MPIFNKSALFQVELFVDRIILRRPQPQQDLRLFVAAERGKKRYRTDIARVSDESSDILLLGETMSFAATLTKRSDSTYAKKSYLLRVLSEEKRKKLIGEERFIDWHVSVNISAFAQIHVANNLEFDLVDDQRQSTGTLICSFRCWWLNDMDVDEDGYSRCSRSMHSMVSTNSQISSPTSQDDDDSSEQLSARPSSELPQLRFAFEDRSRVSLCSA